MYRMIFLVTAALAGCGDNRAGSHPRDAGADASVPQALAPCLAQPTELARPPTGQLPCELLPPDFVAEQP